MQFSVLLDIGSEASFGIYAKSRFSHNAAHMAVAF